MSRASTQARLRAIPRCKECGRPQYSFGLCWEHFQRNGIDALAPRRTTHHDDCGCLTQRHKAEMQRVTAHAEALAGALADAIETVELLYTPADEDDPAPVVIGQWHTALSAWRGGAK